jgi:putative ATP-binding cassette transporter
VKLLSILLKYSRGSFLTAVLTGTLSGLASAGLLALINRVIGGGHEVPGRRLIWTFAVLCVLVPLSRWVSAFLLLRMSQRAIFDLRLQLCRKILAAPLKHLEEIGPHRLLAALTQDIGSMATALTELPLLCMQSAVIGGSLVYLGWLSWRVLLIVLAFLAVGIVSYRLPMRWGTRRQRLAREEGDALFQHFRAVTDGTKELKLHQRRRREFVARLEASASSFQHLNVTARSIFNASASWGQALFFVAVGLILFVVPTVLRPERAVVTGFALVLLYLMNPLQGVLEALPQISQANVAIDKVERLGLSLIDLDHPDQRPAPEPGPDWQELELAGVTHTYAQAGEDRGFTFGPIDLRLRRGELVFVIGGNGSGKTTLAKLIVGLYLPQEGEILLDGEAITDQSREQYRQRFSAVFSDFFLFRELLGLESAALDERSRDYLEQLELSHKVRVEGGKLSTTDLSQGQRKRLALLTAYLEDRPIYLFDEWAADQDPVYKEIFYRQILPSLKSRGKLVLVVCHDDRYFPVADRILKLENGRLLPDQAIAESLAQEVIPCTKSV